MPLLSAPLKRIPTNIIRAAMSTSIRKTKLEYFDEHMKNGWDPNGKFRVHHLFTPHRRSFILDELGRKGVVKPGSSAPLDGLKVLDVGCGAGLMTETMAALGADVTGIDPAESAIQTAKQHAQTHSTSLLPRLQYHNSTAEEHVVSNIEHYDVIIAFLILEHINHREEFLSNCINMLKKDGSIFIQNGNNTWICYLWYYLWQMRVTKLVPKDIVTYSQLLSTNDIVDDLKSLGCNLVNTQGINANFRGDAFYMTKSSRYFNIIHAVKNGH